MNYFTWACLGLFFSFMLPRAEAQQKKPIRISGEIADENRQPGSFANVLILHPVDSTMLTGVVADLDGRFSLDFSGAGSFLVSVSMNGYKKAFSPLLRNEGKDIRLPGFLLQPESGMLAEVTVSARKPFITQETDRMVLHVENSIVAAGATALEVLERAPGVTLDQQNDRIQLRGKDGVVVQIDGKQTYLSEQELVSLLRNTPSDNIEKIELITNPSSRYDAAGNSGIINIRFKRNKNFGTNGSLTLGGGISPPDYFRGNGSLTLNHRAGKLGVFGTLTGFEGSGFNDQTVDRVIPHEGQKTYFDAHSFSNWKARNYSTRLGLDYFASEKTTIGILISAFHNKWSNPFRTTGVTIRNDDGTPRQHYRTVTDAYNRMGNVTGNLYFRHKPAGEESELTFDLDYVGYDGRGYNSMDTRYFTPDSLPDGAPDLVRNNMPSRIGIGVAKLDYSRKIGEYKLETGLKSSYVASDNDMVFEKKSDDWMIDSSRTNRFRYTENISAAYASFSGNINRRTRFMAGIRAEHTFSSGNSVTLGSITKRNYLDFFPSVFISRDLDSNNVVNLSYSRRIDRPGYQSLNPFEFYLDPYTFQRGNPNLKPQYTHSLQLTHVYRSFLNTTLAYSRVRDMIAREVPMQIAEENKTYLTADNLDKQNYFSLTIGAPLPVNKWWNLQVNLSGAFNEYSTFYRNAPYHMRLFTWNAYANNQVTLPCNWTFEAGGWYNSPAIFGLMAARSHGMVNLGLQKSINNKKTTVRLNVQDLFQTNRFRGSTQFEDIDVKVRATWPSRQFRLAVTHRFGNQHVKSARRRNTGADELQKRVSEDSNG